MACRAVSGEEKEVQQRVIQNSPTGREFEMTYADFQKIRKLAYEITGINLSDQKQNMIYGRLARRLRVLGIRRFDDYCDLIAQKDSPELGDFVNAITTNLTAFFREGHHFDYLKEKLIPDLIKNNLANKRLRIWSAGCSTGEEPYSIAMVFKSFASLSNWDLKILATDLDTNVVAKAKAGIYSQERADTIPAEYQKFVEKNKSDDTVQIKSSVKQLITFKQLNLLNQWPMKGPFDIIFCRNVVIYFDSKTQKMLFNRYADILKSNGHLFIGHSENLHKVCDRFDGLGRTIYKRNR